MAGNAVILKHAAQTLLVGDRFQQAMDRAGLPKGLFRTLTLSHDDTTKLIGSGAVDQICFTGSVAAGKTIERAAAGTFAGVGLELGGKDPAYVRPDVDLKHAVENVVDGAYFNSGQCCCGIERVYVHADVYDRFVDGFVDLTKQYVLGDPLDQKTTLGPMAQPRLAATVRDHIGEALHKGARALIDTKAFARDKDGSTYLAPQVLVECRPRDEGDDGRDLRSCGRHHEGEGRRRGDPPDERLAVRPDRVDLDPRHGCGRAHRARDRDRHRLHEPRRLSRSGSRLDRREGHRPRRDALARRLRVR